MSEKKIVFLRGPVYWAKVVGAPVANYNKDGYEWCIDVELNDESLSTVRSLGLKDRIKEGKDGSRTYQYLHVRQKDVTFADGARVDPPKIIDKTGALWDGITKIGNKSVCDVKITVKGNGTGKKDSIYLNAVRVLELVPYNSVEFAPLSEDDEFFASGGETDFDEADFPEDTGDFEDDDAA